MRIILQLSFLFILFSPASSLANEKISVACNTSTQQNYQKLIESKGGDPFALTDYTSPYSSRPVIFLLILKQALHLGGLDADLTFIPCPNPGRSISEVKSGRAVVYSSDIWEQHFDDSVYMTSPLIRKGEFQKGFYVNKNSELIKQSNIPDKIRTKIPLVEHTWIMDIALLKKMGFKHIQTAPKYDLLFKMINKNRADFVILEFPKSDSLINTNKNGNLYPIPNVKMVFPYSRHFMVSKRHSKGKQVYEALEKGLKILRENGTIERALRQAGVINDKVKDWTIINP